LRAGDFFPHRFDDEGSVASASAAMAMSTA
jgi:hypothetical protein